MKNSIIRENTSGIVHRFESAYRKFLTEESAAGVELSLCLNSYHRIAGGGSAICPCNTVIDASAASDYNKPLNDISNPVFHRMGHYTK